jgi:hypothetical protein
MNQLSPTVYWHKKFDHPPLIKAGRELITIDYSTGWIEYLSKTQDIYYSPGLTQSQVKKFINQYVNPRLQSYALSTDFTNIGFLKTLVDIRLHEPFILPIFGKIKSDLYEELTCGVSRFAATVLSGKSDQPLPVIWQVDRAAKFSPPSDWQLITDTVFLEKIASLVDVEYRIGFDHSTDMPYVINSIIRNTEYDLTNNNKTIDFDKEGQDTFAFWERYRNNKTGKIDITIACTEAEQKFIKYSDQFWTVTYQIDSVPSFSFSKILEEFGNANDAKLRLDVRGVTESFCLERLTSLVHKNTVWYHTQDKKLCLIDTGRGPASACWPIKVWGNLVK